ncbi:hypothetical protein M0R88_04785 [Halorussus gelatinilyticus]|uniref:Tetrapyrrole biosynthesis glutamyl-tRNA reductase dimerisation domain-containing protein n=1 Tax=Halorussus gelatinilyticus TaxID=2937524 RepID=A0A8U0IJW9_9EURY|nr:hypothetical protein [Halorussus gelatinilyticus]UPW01420.1 hypothetical protein M0R88_04785 [Halorussus gelatinilyticus]
MTELGRLDSESATTADPGPEADAERLGDFDAGRGGDAGASAAAERVRARGRRVRRRELDTALRRLDERGDLSRDERRVLERLAARLTDAMVEQWASKLADGEVDSETALGLLTE